MNKLYVIGGAPRCGKTTILNEILRKKPMIGVSSDAVRAGVRYLNQIKRIDYKEEFIEDVLPWELMVGLIQRYDHQNVQLVVEGVIFTPERLKSLQLKNLELKAVFVGFTSEDYINTIIDHGKKNKDWVYQDIELHNGNEDNIRSVFSGVYKKSVDLKINAEKEEFRFFQIDQLKFEEFKDEVVNYLLE